MSYYEKVLELKPAIDMGRCLIEAGYVMKTKPVDLPSKPGYKWEAIPNTEDKTVSFVEVEDPGAPGVKENPIPWEAGMKVQVNYWYISGDVKKVCAQAGNHVDFDNGSCFVEV